MSDLQEHVEGAMLTLVFYGSTAEMIRPSTASLLVLAPQTLTGLMDLYANRTISVLVLGPLLSPKRATEALAAVCGADTRLPSLNIVFNAGDHLQLFEDFLVDDHIFYISRRPLAAETMASIIDACLGQASRLSYAHLHNTLTSKDQEVLIYQSRFRAQHDMKAATHILREFVCEMFQGSTATLFIHDATEQTIYEPDNQDLDERDSTSAGLVGLIVKTATLITSECIDQDPRADIFLDALGETPQVRFMGAPIIGESGAVIAVIATVREGFKPPFRFSDIELLSRISRVSAPNLAALIEQRNMRVSLSRELTASAKTLELFREEALLSQTEPFRSEDQMLNSIPAWLRSSHWILSMCACLGVAYLGLAKTPETVVGPAFIQARYRVNVDSVSSGLISQVNVVPGQRIEFGSVIASIRDSPGESISARLRNQVLAPLTGTVSDVTVHEGQLVIAGEQIASIVDQRSSKDLVIFIPGRFAPQIHIGMPILLRLNGYPGSAELLTLTDVSSRVTSVEEAAKSLSAEPQGSVQLEGPVMIATAHLTKPIFQDERQTFEYRDGMLGSAEIQVRSEPLLFTLIPGLRTLRMSKGAVLD